MRELNITSTSDSKVEEMNLDLEGDPWPPEMALLVAINRSIRERGIEATRLEIEKIFTERDTPISFPEHPALCSQR